MGAVVIEEQDVQDDAATDTNGNGTPKARRKQVPKAPTFLSSLDLTTAPVSLQHFCNREESHGAERQVPRSGHMVQGADEEFCEEVWILIQPKFNQRKATGWN